MLGRLRMTVTGPGYLSPAGIPLGAVNPRLLFPSDRRGKVLFSKTQSVSGAWERLPDLQQSMAWFQRGILRGCLLRAQDEVLLRWGYIKGLAF